MESPLKTSESGEEMLEKIFFRNSVQDYLTAILIVLGAIALYTIVKKILTRRFAKANSPVQTYFIKIEGSITPLLYLLFFYAAFHSLVVVGKAATFFNHVFTIGFIFLAVRLLTATIRTLIYTYLTEQDGTDDKLKQVKGLVIILNSVLWIIGLIFLFGNLGFDVTAVITGLGVGGIAIALAAQTILGDIFNYFVIFFDRPFEVGDFIVVDDKLGIVEYVGLKTTRLKSLSGEQIVFSNSNLTNSRIHNYKRMTERRVLFKFGVVYETGKEKLNEIPGMIKAIVEQQNGVRFDRAHFASFGEYSLNFEVVYYISTSDYNQYMDVQQEINKLIHGTFEDKGILFAYPTYVVNMNKPVG